MNTNQTERMRRTPRVVSGKRGKSTRAARMVTLERRAIRALKYGGQR